MENFDDNIEKEYRSRFEDFEEMPDDRLWNNIQTRIKPEKERPLVIWWNNLGRTTSIAATLLIGLAVGAYFLLKEDKSAQLGGLPEKPVIEKPKEHALVNKTDEEDLAAEQRINNQLPVAERNEKLKNRAFTNKTPMADPLAWNTFTRRHKTPAGIQENNNGVSVIDSVESKSLALNELYVLKGKQTNLFAAGKHLQVPELNNDEVALEVEQKSRKIFTPPSEVFVNVNPTLSYYMFSPNKGDNILVSDFSNSSQRLGFGAQIGFVYPLARKLNLRTGLSYFTRKSNISYDVTDDSKKNVVVVDNNSIQINPGSSVMSESKNWQYLELQSDVLYTVKHMQALSVGFKLGMQPSSITSPLVQGRLGYRISRPVNNRWALWLEPSVSISLLSQNSAQNLFMYRTTGFGLNLGVSLLR